MTETAIITIVSACLEPSLSSPSGTLYARARIMLTLFLWVLALVLFLLAGFGVPDGPRFRLGWLGAAAATLAVILSHWPK